MMDRVAVAEMISGGLYLIPKHMHEAVVNYFVYRRKPGSFLSALLRNDFMEAAVMADEDNGKRLREWAVFLHNYAPPKSCGSREAFDQWLKGEMT